jgi:hypothetical protein
MGWVKTVEEKLRKFANSPEEETAIGEYVGGLGWCGTLKTISRPAVTGHETDDWLNGRRMAADIQIQHGIDGEDSGGRFLTA